jgi:hypothetical protein
MAESRRSRKRPAREAPLGADNVSKRVRVEDGALPLMAAESAGLAGLTSTESRMARLEQAVFGGAAHSAGGAGGAAASSAGAPQLAASSALPASSSLVTINVGGRLFHTRRTTLCQFPGFLEALLSGRHRVDWDAEGHVFLDRSPELFAFVLALLRDPGAPVHIPDALQAELMHELTYFGLKDVFYPPQDVLVVVGGWQQYSAGGNYEAPLRCVEFLDPRTLTWHELPPLLKPRSQFGMCLLHNRLFAIGGLTSDEQLGGLASVEAFDLETGKW